MALRELGQTSGLSVRRCLSSSLIDMRRRMTRSVASAAVADLEPQSAFDTPPASEEERKAFDPIARSRSRTKQLPRSRYQYRPPKYYRGPLHPHQPPPDTDPNSRVFVPGPFTLPRLEQTYQSTIAPDIMTLTYQHSPYGTRAPVPGQRLREWTGDSPYFKNRPLRKPRGGDVLPLIMKPITFRNVPKVTGVTVHSMVKKATTDSAYLHVAGMAVQAISNVRVTTHAAKTHVQQWDLKKGDFVSLSVNMNEEDSLHFLSKTIDMVLPRFKDWRGVRGSSGDSSGNIAFGLTPEQVALYPEIEVNYDMYPPRLIPGCHIFIRTSATNDRDARLLLSAMGLPFYGKLVD